MKRRVVFLSLISTLTLGTSKLIAETLPDAPLDPICGNLTENTFRKSFDYNSPPPDLLRIVEEPHFPPYVERLQRGSTSDTPGHDISYTLRTFPNHPRALMSMINLGRKEKSNKPKGADFTIDCFLKRAVSFRPEDGTVRQIYGIELMRRKQFEQALEQFKKAEELLGTSGNVAYNLGLAYFETGNYDESLKYAHIALAAGFPLPALKNKLIAKGKWKSPLPPETPTPDMHEAKQ